MSYRSTKSLRTTKYTMYFVLTFSDRRISFANVVTLNYETKCTKLLLYSRSHPRALVTLHYETPR